MMVAIKIATAFLIVKKDVGGSKKSNNNFQQWQRKVLRTSLKIPILHRPCEWEKQAHIRVALGEDSGRPVAVQSGEEEEEER